MHIVNNIKPLPTAPVKCTESVPCPWCLLDQDPPSFPGPTRCEDCGQMFDILENAESDDLVVQGVRSETDRKYMEAMGVTEAMVFDAHREDV